MLLDAMATSGVNKLASETGLTAAQQEVEKGRVQGELVGLVSCSCRVWLGQSGSLHGLQTFLLLLRLLVLMRHWLTKYLLLDFCLNLQKYFFTSLPYVALPWNITSIM
jgi:hypothetical protein